MSAKITINSLISSAHLATGLTFLGFPKFFFLLLESTTSALIILAARLANPSRSVSIGKVGKIWYRVLCSSRIGFGTNFVLFVSQYYQHFHLMDLMEKPNQTKTKLICRVSKILLTLMLLYDDLLYNKLRNIPLFMPFLILTSKFNKTLLTDAVISDIIN